MNHNRAILIEKSDLTKIFIRFEKSPQMRKIGIEQEAFLVRKADGLPARYAGAQGIESLLRELLDDSDFGKLLPNPKADMDGSNIIGVSSDTANVSLEPGGAIELSGAPYSNLSDAQRELVGFNQILDVMAHRHGLDLVRLGHHPTARRADIKMIPKSRYGIMRPIIESTGSRGVDMMLRTTTVQANMDFVSEAEMVRFFRLGLRLSPIIYYLFQNSPRLEGNPTTNFNERGLIWLDTDAERCGYPPVVFDEDFGYEKWVDWVCSVPMYFIRRDDKYINTHPMTFQQFLDKGMEGYRATIQDFQDHLSTIFTEVRLKPQLEFRSADGGDVEQAMGIGAFWKGLLYDELSLDAAEALMGGLSADELSEIQRDVSLKGGAAAYASSTVQVIARDVLEIARQGLHDDAHYLDFLSEKMARP